MPAIGPHVLIDAINSAIEASGQSGLLLSNARQHPRRFLITHEGEASVEVWVYVWTLTPGGRTSLPHEYRIQMTTVRSPLGLNPSGPTILIGYEPDLGLFAGFDLSHHRTFTTGSPSVQIDIRVVRQSLALGMTFDRKTNDEIAIGFRPDHFVAYVANVVELHRLGRFPDTFRLLQRAASLEPVAQNEIDVLSEPRRRIVETVSRLSRRANFRQQVLRAYGNRCAVTGLQLRLVDAAHILPVGAPGSSDDVRNGIALAPTFHRAFDNGLIYLDPEYNMVLNAAKAEELRTLNLGGGLQQIRDRLSRIHLPPDRAQWPNVQLIRNANTFRRIAV